jgi:Na+-driven multidrug efflux pump
MGIGLTEFLLFVIMVMFVPAAWWMVSKRRNGNQKEKQQKKAVGLVLVGGLVWAMVVFVLYVFVHHP